MKSAFFSVIGAGILWGCMGLFVRTLSGFGFSSLQIVFFRLVVAAICFLVMSCIKGIRCIRISSKDIPLMFAMGFCGIMLMSVTYFLAITYSSLSLAAILLYTAPAFVLIASVFLFKEKLNKIKIASLLLALGGLIFVSGIFDGDANVTVSGIVWGLLSGITYGSYSIFGTYALRKYQSFTCASMAFFFSAASSVFFADIPDIVQKFSMCTDKITLIVTVVLMGILSAFLPFMLYTYGLSKIGASKAVVIASVEPMTATVLGTVIYHESLTVLTVVGIIMILISVVLASLKKNV